eukprot:352579-Chlamydomonas_euryale.AAC.1
MQANKDTWVRHKAMLAGTLHEATVAGTLHEAMVAGTLHEATIAGTLQYRGREGGEGRGSLLTNLSHWEAAWHSDFG